MCLHISPPVQCVYTTVEEEEEEEERDVCRHTVHHQDIKNVSHYSFFFLFFCFNSRNRPAPLFPLLSASCYRVDTCGELGNSSAAINGRNSSRRHCVSSKAPKQRASFICLYTLGGEREKSLLLLLLLVRRVDHVVAVVVKTPSTRAPPPPPRNAVRTHHGQRERE